MQFNKYYLLILLFPFMVTCQEVYYPEELNANLQIPVIDGYLSDNDDPCTVSLHWAAVYNSDEINPIENAIITLNDDKGNEEPLDYISMGKYSVTSPSFITFPGRKYSIHIELSDGSIYESKPQAMPVCPEIDTLYAEIDKKQFVTSSASGELLVNEQKGLYVYADIISDSSKTQYFRFNQRVIWQNLHYINMGTPSQTEVRCWTRNSIAELPIINATNLIDNKQTIQKQLVRFLTYKPMTTEPEDGVSVTYTKGWIVSVEIHEISAEAHNFYESMNSQLNAKERIFDPIPSQIIGNINCVNDTTKLALGLFEVSSQKSAHSAFYWIYGRNIYKSIHRLKDPGLPKSFCLERERPYFWVDFY